MMPLNYLRPPPLRARPRAGFTLSWHITSGGASSRLSTRYTRRWGWRRCMCMTNRWRVSMLLCLAWVEVAEVVEEAAAVEAAAVEAAAEAAVEEVAAADRLQTAGARGAARHQRIPSCACRMSAASRRRTYVTCARIMTTTRRTHSTSKTTPTCTCRATTLRPFARRWRRRCVGPPTGPSCRWSTEVGSSTRRGASTHTIRCTASCTRRVRASASRCRPRTKPTCAPLYSSAARASAADRAAYTRSCLRGTRRRRVSTTDGARPRRSLRHGC